MAFQSVFVQYIFSITLDLRYKTNGEFFKALFCNIRAQGSLDVNIEQTNSFPYMVMIVISALFWEKFKIL